MDETTTMAAELQNKYTLRDLEAKDVFLMSKIIGAIGVDKFKDCLQSDEIKALTQSADGENMAATVGIAVFLNVADVVFNNLPNCEKDIYALLANLSGMKTKDVESLPMATFFDMIIDVCKKEEFKDFMKVVSKLFR